MFEEEQSLTKHRKDLNSHKGFRKEKKTQIINTNLCPKRMKREKEKEKKKL